MYFSDIDDVNPIDWFTNEAGSQAVTADTATDAAAGDAQAVGLRNKRNRDESLAETVALIHALQLGGDGIGDGQVAEGPQAIHLLDQEGLQPPSAGVVEDLPPDMSQGSHHLAVRREASASCEPSSRAKSWDGSCGWRTCDFGLCWRSTRRGSGTSPGGWRRGDTVRAECPCTHCGHAYPSPWAGSFE